MRRLLVLLLALAAPAHAQEIAAGSSDELKAECATAYAQTQRDLQAGRQVEALKNAVFCAQASCPEILVGDCTRWTRELEASLPTIVLEARDEGGNLLTEVSVEIDGKPVASRLDGRALPVNPGEHVFRFEHASRQVERRFVVVEGGKNQRLLATFPRFPQPDDGLRPTEPNESGTARSPLVYVPLGLAALGGAGFAYFGLKGNARYDELADDCAPRCTDSELDSVQRDWLLADVSLGVSVVSLGVFGWLMLSGDGSPPPAEVDVSPSGAAVRYRARF